MLKIDRLDARFPHRVSFHTSCHGQRSQRVSLMSECNEPPFSKPGYLLSLVDGLDLVYPRCLVIGAHGPRSLTLFYSTNKPVCLGNYSNTAAQNAENSPRR